MRYPKRLSILLAIFLMDSPFAHKTLAQAPHMIPYIGVIEVNSLPYQWAGTI